MKARIFLAASGVLAALFAGDAAAQDRGQRTPGSDVWMGPSRDSAITRPAPRQDTSVGRPGSSDGARHGRGDRDGRREWRGGEGPRGDRERHGRGDRGGRDGWRHDGRHDGHRWHGHRPPSWHHDRHRHRHHGHYWSGPRHWSSPYHGAAPYYLAPSVPLFSYGYLHEPPVYVERFVEREPVYVERYIEREPVYVERYIERVPEPERHAQAPEVPQVATPRERVAPSPPAQPAPRIERMTLSATELFEFDKATLRMPQPKLDAIADAMLRHADIEDVRITGHTDRLGSEAYNLQLSIRRAEAVKAYLVGKGVASHRLVAAGRGEAQPIVQCDDKDRAALIRCLEPNRRVEVEQITIEMRR